MAHELPHYKLARADSFEWLSQQPPSAFHAVVTDPPFGIVEFSPLQLEKRRDGKGGIWRLPQSFDGRNRKPMPRFTALKPKDLSRITMFHSALAPLLYRVLVPGGHVIMASQNLLSHLVIGKFLDAGFEIRGQIARVIKTLRGGDRPKGAHEDFPDVSVIPRSNWEPWLVFRKPIEGRIQDNLREWGTGALRRPRRDKPFTDLILSGRAPREESDLADHPSLKPQDFMRRLVWAALPLGRGVILDPFMGAGSTIAAASATGLESVGIEIDEIYFKVAKKAIPLLAKVNTTWMPEMIGSPAESD